MAQKKWLILIFIMTGFLFETGCKSRIKEVNDQLYSRHLQRQVSLSMVSTKMPDDKSDMNLLIMLQGEGLEQVDLSGLLDSLDKSKQIKPLMIVSVQGKPDSEYGMATSGRKSSLHKSDNFNNFIINELYPHIKKKSGVRKFNSVSICGSKRSGINAFETAWNNADKIKAAGVFSGSFEFDYSESDSSLPALFNMVKSSRKRSKLQYWFYAGEADNQDIPALTKEFCALLKTKSFVAPADITLVTPVQSGNGPDDWKRYVATFIISTSAGKR